MLTAAVDVFVTIVVADFVVWYSVIAEVFIIAIDDELPVVQLTANISDKIIIRTKTLFIDYPSLALCRREVFNTVVINLQ